MTMILLKVIIASAMKSLLAHLESLRVSLRGLQLGYEVDSGQDCREHKEDVQGNQQWCAERCSCQPLILQHIVPAYS